MAYTNLYPALDDFGITATKSRNEFANASMTEGHNNKSELFEGLNRNTLGEKSITAADSDHNHSSLSLR